MRLTKIAASLLAAGAIMAGCSKNDQGSGTTVPEGSPTYMQLSFRVPDTAGTRADNGDVNATSDESDINTVDVFIFNASTGVQSTYQRISVNASTFDHTDGTAVYTGKVPIATTTGAKKVVVGVNLSSDQAALLQAQSFNSVMSKIHDYANKFSLAEVTGTSNGFVMFSRQEVNAVFDADPNDPSNTVDIYVERIVAKLTVQIGPNYTVYGGAARDLKFTVYNMNTKTFALRNMPVTPTGTTNAHYNAETRSPNHLIASYVDTDYVNENSSYVNVNVAADQIEDLNNKYFFENTNETPLEKVTTYASIRAEFIPEKIYKKNSGVWEEIANPNLPGNYKDFYAIVLNQARYYFEDLAEAKDFALDYNLEVETGEQHEKDLLYFKDGVCYYNMFLNPKSAYNVYRNDYYQATIRNIMGPGNPGPGPVDPELPVELPTTIIVDINVLEWNLQDYEYDLMP